MIEFGSDFHLINTYFLGRASLKNIYKNAVFYANGRQCINSLILQYHWKRIWCPQYFCYEVISSIRNTGIDIKYYLDYPGYNDISAIKNIPFEEGDVLLRVNYFGMREFRTEKNIPIPVIEDHTHDLLGHWALYSDATWCIASLRKSLPLAEGGMLWSPQGYELKDKIQLLKENVDLAEERWKAMELKSQYLARKISNKALYREMYMRTEKKLEFLPFSLIDRKSQDVISRIDINAWYGQKKKNWDLLSHLDLEGLTILHPESWECNMYSFIILLETEMERDRVRKKFIQSHIYPAILWNIPEMRDEHVLDFSARMLSIHCDGRYKESDILKLIEKIKQIILHDSSI